MYDQSIRLALDSSEQAAATADLATALEALDNLALLTKDLKVTQDSWRARAISLLRESGEVQTESGQKVKAIKKYKRRYDHNLIRMKMIRKAFSTEDGERIEDAETAMQRLAALFEKVYLAPSSEPKKTGLAILGFETPDAALASKEEDGYELHRSV